MLTIPDQVNKKTLKESCQTEPNSWISIHQILDYIYMGFSYFFSIKNEIVIWQGCLGDNKQRKHAPAIMTLKNTNIGNHMAKCLNNKHTIYLYVHNLTLPNTL